MIERLQKKLTVLLLTCTMLVFTAAMLVMAGHAVTQIRSSEIRYGNNLTDSTLAQIRRGNHDFSRYPKSQIMVRLTDGATTQSSPECFPTPLETLIERAKGADTILSMLGEAAEDNGYAENRTVHAVSGNQKDGYYAIHSTLCHGDRMVLDLILVYPRASGWKVLKDGCDLYPIIWLGVLALMYLLSRFATRKAVAPVEAAMGSQKEFIASASHELKAPLAVIQVNAEIMEPSPKQKVILEECSRMSRLIQSMLALASSDAGSWHMEIRETNVDALLIEAWEQFCESAKKQHIQLNLNIEDHYPRIPCDAERIGQVLSILLDNAITHSAPGQSIEMGARVQPKQLVLSVTDHGPGIPDGEKEKVFQRFYSGDPSRTDKSHFGLGLSIAREIVKLHHGAIRLRDTPGGGCTFEVCLPMEKRF